MRALVYVQQGFECNDIIYPSLYKYLMRVAELLARLKKAAAGRCKKRKLKRKK